MTVTELSKKLKTDPHGVYLFYGEEEYLKRRSLEQIRDAIPDDGFNHVRISGDLQALSEELDGLALFGGDRLIELWDTDFSKVGGEQLEALCEVLGAAEDTVILYTHPDEFPAGTAYQRPLSRFSIFLMGSHREETLISRLIATTK